jgi:hypothetical protein
MISRGAFLAVVSLLFLGLAGAVGAGQDRVLRTSSTSVPIMPLNEIKPGMTGTIRTVFRGDQIEEFGFEVLGIMKNSLGPKQDIILVRLRGTKPEFTGVVAGMSGSPVYIDGKLIGALSLRFGLFAKEPVAGITPIESMLSLFEMKEEKPPSPGREGEKEREGDQEIVASSSLSISPSPHLSISPSLSDASRWLEPIPSPLFFSGFSQEVIDRFAPLFRQHHLVPLRGGAGSLAGLSFTAETADFVPGAPVAGVLVAGDLGIYGTGTLSYRDKDRVLAFGHPFFQIGATDMPMAKATVLTTLASEMASFKIAEVKEVVGTIRQDRLTAIMGLVGAKPNMIPVRINVRSPFRGLLPYRYEVFHHPALTPLLFNMTLSASVLNALEQADDITIEYSGTIRLAGHPEVRLQDRLTSSDNSFFVPVAFQAANQIGGVFGRLFTNRYETPKITGVEIDIRVVEERRLAVIEEMRASREEVRPGEQVTVVAVLRPYRGERMVKSFTLKIPENVTRGDQLIVTVSDANTLRVKERRFVTGATGSLDEFIEVLNRDRVNDRVYCQLSHQAPGYLIQDRLLPSLPPSIISVIESSRTSASAVRVNESPLVVQDQEVGLVVSGSRDVTLTVR